jgi:hypothetical protein
MKLQRTMPATVAAALLLPAIWLMGMTAAAAEEAAPRIVSCKPIRTVEQLQAITGDLAGDYCLANDIDAGAVGNFVPIGAGVAPFTGRLFGNHHAIRNLTIVSNASAVGLFAWLDGALVRDLHLVNASVTANNNPGNVAAGGLAAFMTGASSIDNVHVGGQVACQFCGLLGGLVGGIFGAGGETTEAKTVTALRARPRSSTLTRGPTARESAERLAPSNTHWRR